MPRPENKISEIFSKAILSNRTFLMEHESKTILEAFAIPFPKYIIAKSGEEAAEAAEKLGYPVVLKILSPSIIHKSDCGGVLLNLNNKDEVKHGYDTIINSVSKIACSTEITGVIVYKMVPTGVIELIIGASYDNQFGHFIMVGAGGIFVELLKDVSIRLAPISEADGEEMINELKSYPILSGFRGGKKADVEAATKILVKVSSLIISYPNIVELDLNPVMVYEKGACVIDARIIIRK